MCISIGYISGITLTLKTRCIRFDNLSVMYPDGVAVLWRSVSCAMPSYLGVSLAIWMLVVLSGIIVVCVRVDFVVAFYLILLHIELVVIHGRSSNGTSVLSRGVILLHKSMRLSV